MVQNETNVTANENNSEILEVETATTTQTQVDVDMIEYQTSSTIALNETPNPLQNVLKILTSIVIIGFLFVIYAKLVHKHVLRKYGEKIERMKSKNKLVKWFFNFVDQVRGCDSQPICLQPHRVAVRPT